MQEQPDQPHASPFSGRLVRDAGASADGQTRREQMVRASRKAAARSRVAGWWDEMGGDTFTRGERRGLRSDVRRACQQPLSEEGGRRSGPTEIPGDPNDVIGISDGVRCETVGWELELERLLGVGFGVQFKGLVLVPRHDS